MGSTLAYLLLYYCNVIDMASAGLVYVANKFGFINSAFCATVQLHKGLVMKSVREGTENFIDQNFIVKHDWDASWNPNYALNKAFADLVMSHNALTTEEPDPKRIEDRRYHFDLLLRWLPLLWCSQGALVHYCPLGCCQSRADSVQKIDGAFHAVYTSV